MGVFVLVACPDTALLDSRDFLSPVITAFEAELAFSPGGVWTPGGYRIGFGAAAAVPTDVPSGGAEEAPFSLLTGMLVGSMHRAAPGGSCGASESRQLTARPPLFPPHPPRAARLTHLAPRRLSASAAWLPRAGRARWRR